MNLPDLPDCRAPQTNRTRCSAAGCSNWSVPSRTVARTILVLRYQEDMSPDEISGTLDMPVATVKSHLQRTLRLLREKSSTRA